ncbi:cell envelope biogenesis protein OmpA, partial [Nguyenibacter vanlangensis]|nr:cell envelope biogenesis protein OmpA [Nguyenibacter vanlangensis]
MTIRVHAPLLARSAILGAGLLALAGCSNPYDPGQRALG